MASADEIRQQIAKLQAALKSAEEAERPRCYGGQRQARYCDAGGNEGRFQRDRRNCARYV